MADRKPLKAVRPAAQYLRMSTEHQRYSPKHQSAAIARYAETRGYEVVRTYADEGISGISIRNRKGLQQLLADVLGGAAEYDVILVYDVSRWGRFQNPDQSAHYEFLCAEAGVQVEYCAELFDNDGSLSSTLLKSLKRVMAAEYSRELSVKTTEAHTHLVKLGFWQGGPACYGLRRQAQAPDGRLGPVLELGEFKGIHGHRTILVPGPPAEVAVINRIFRLYALAGRTQQDIARLLNREGIGGWDGRAWTPVRIAAILRNRNYVGDLEYPKSDGELGGPRHRRPRSAWIRVTNAVTPIVSKSLFEAAQRELATRSVRMSTEAMLKVLRDVYDQHGRITRQLIRETPGVSNPEAFASRFGSMARASAAIGKPRAEEPKQSRIPLDSITLLARLEALFARKGYLNTRMIDADPSLPTSHTIWRRFGGLRRAYLAVGYDELSPDDLASPVGRARADALALQREQARSEFLARPVPERLTRDGFAPASWPPERK